MCTVNYKPRDILISFWTDPNLKIKNKDYAGEYVGKNFKKIGPLYWTK